MVELDLKQHIAEQFLQFAEIECKASTPFYYYLSQFVANDNTMLELASYCSCSQPRPNLLFAAIQFLLQSNEELPGKENLKEWYPSLTNNPKPVREIELPIQFFISQNREQIIELLQTRLVQTNEVRRSTFLYPAFLETERRTYNSPLALIEIGTSASLNLIWDQYNYSYGSNLHVDNGAPFVLDTTLRGSLNPNVRSWKGTITHRIGIDLHPIDLRNEEERKWLQALIWPEHHDRVKLFNQAASLLTSNTITRHVGNCVEILPHVANDIPSDSQLVIYHTSTAYQFSKELDAAVKEQIRILSGNRRIFHLSGESCYSEHYQLDLSEYNNGELVSSETLAYCDSHGKWIEWKIAQ